MNPVLEHPHPQEGFGAGEALRWLLAAYGKTPGPRAALEDRGLAGQDALVSELERHSLLGRWAHLAVSDLRSLQLPSLAKLADGSYWLLTGWRKGQLVAQGPQGERWLQPVAGTYLDVALALPAGSLWQRIWKQLMTQPRALVPILAAALLMQMLSLLLPQLTRIMVDQVFPQGARSLFSLVLAASAFLGFYRAWVGWLQGRFELFLEARLGFVIEQGLFAHLLRLPYAWLSGRRIGDLLQGFFGLAAARQFLTGQLLSTMVSCCAALGYFVLMFNTLPVATVGVAASALFCAGATILVGHRVATIQTEAISAQIKERSFLVEMLNGVAVVKATGAESQVESKWMNLFRRRRSLDLAGQRISLCGMGLLGLFQSLLTQLLTLWGGYQVLQGQLRLGEMLAFTMMAGSFQQAVALSGDLYLRVVRMKPQLAKAQEILETQPEPVLAYQGKRESSCPVHIQDLCFRYRPDGPWVIENLTLTIAPGEKVVLRGPSGCGKSTLLKLAANLHAAEKGGILFGSVPAAQARPLLAYLPQFIQLFNGSILENLRLLSAGASRAELMAAARTIGLSELVATLPMGYETLVSPGGGNFSGGQRQLIALTAVLASSRQVLLLDEAMANLDTISKTRLFASELFRGKTVLLASHEDAQGQASAEQHGFRRILLD